MKFNTSYLNKIHLDNLVIFMNYHLKVKNINYVM